MIHYFERQLREFEYSVQSLEEQVFSRWVDNAVDILKKGNKIVVSGLGKNVPICEKFVGSMVSIGRALFAYQFGYPWGYGSCKNRRYGDFAVKERRDRGIYFTGKAVKKEKHEHVVVDFF